MKEFTTQIVAYPNAADEMFVSVVLLVLTCVLSPLSDGLPGSTCEGADLENDDRFVSKGEVKSDWGSYIFSLTPSP